MYRAIWKDTIVAESDQCIEVEGNQYFPPEAVRTEVLRPSDTQTICSWKGTASYHDIVVGDAINKDAAWYYPAPKTAAAEIKDHLAFWRGVEVVKV